MSDYDYYDYLAGESCVTLPDNSFCVGVCMNGPISNLSVDHIWLTLADITAILISILLASGFIIAATRYRCWHNNKILKNLLGLARYPLYQVLGNLIMIALSARYSNEHYVVWGVLLFAGFGSFYSIVGYTLYTENKMKLMMANEKMQISNNLTVLTLLIVYYVWYDMKTKQTNCAAFIRPLWAIWAVSMFKVVQRMRSFNAADSSYGKENTRQVAQFMKNEHNLTHGNVYNPQTMDGYKYLVMGDNRLRDEYSSSAEVMPVTNWNILTIDEVWQCDEGLIKKRIKDTCLSFALFKLIKRRFEGLTIAEARDRKTRDKTRDFVLNGLLTDFDRAFKVVDVELRFLRDYFYSSTPVTFGAGLLVQELVLFCMIGVTFGVAISRVIHYKPSEKNNDNIFHGKNIDLNIDLIVTAFILCLVMLMMFFEFFLSLFSDWAKITLVYLYIKHRKWVDVTPISFVLSLVLRVNLWGYSKVALGQYSLLEDFRFDHSKLVHKLRDFFGMKSIKGFNRVRYVHLEQSTKEITLDSLKKLLQMGEPELTNGVSTLNRYDLRTQMGWACTNHTHTRTIMIWHIATSFCELDSPYIGSDKTVAHTLSNYCAYLVVCAPEFLPVSTKTARSIFDQTVEETNTFFGKAKKDKYYKMMVDFGVEEKDQMTIIEKGARLGNQLISLIKDDERRWKFLAEFWGELILFMAPSGNSTAHAKKLAIRAEFITYLWTLLNHAGILDRPHTEDEDDGSLV